MYRTMMRKEQEMKYIIVVGLDKTGTTCMKEALELIYHKPCFHFSDLVHSDRSEVDEWLQLADSSMEKKEKLQRLKSLLQRYPMACGFPISAHFQEILELYPNSKFILTVRDAETWLATTRSTTLPKDHEKMDYKLFHSFRDLLGMEKLDRLYETTMRACLGSTVNFDEDTQVLEAYVHWNEQVQRTIPSEQLLVYNVKEGWEPLCTFLDTDVPNQRFPGFCRRKSSLIAWNKSTLDIWTHWIVFGLVYITIGVCTFIYIR